MSGKAASQRQTDTAHSINTINENHLVPIASVPETLEVRIITTIPDTPPLSCPTAVHCSASAYPSVTADIEGRLSGASPESQRQGVG